MDVINEIGLFVQGMGVPAAICIILGTVLIIIEMFTPGFAVPGISGIILLLLGIVLTADSFFQGLLIFLVMMALLTVVLIIVIRSATKGALFKTPLIHKNSETSEEGFISTTDMQVFVGKVGKAISPLRPAGTCDFDGVRLDVVTEGDFIDRGNNVIILKVEGRRIVVTKKN